MCKDRYKGRTFLQVNKEYCKAQFSLASFHNTFNLYFYWNTLSTDADVSFLAAGDTSARRAIDASAEPLAAL